MAKNYISIRWYVEDVLWQAKNDDIAVTKKEAREILGIIEKNYDPMMGISWDTLSDEIYDYFFMP